MTGTDNLRGYRVGNPPVLPDSDRRYLADELQKVSMAFNELIQAVKALEKRMSSHGI